MSWIFSSIPATSMKGRFTFHFLFPDIIQTKSLLEVSKGKVEIREPLSSSSMEGWAPALLPVSDASIDKARGKMATVHPGACILKLLQPAAFRWALTAKKNSVSAGPLVFFHDFQNSITITCCDDFYHRSIRCLWKQVKEVWILIFDNHFNFFPPSSGALRQGAHRYN